jgi:hypothetical protein
MANTTNYNWETPDDTDLVKDGAAAIRTLGNSVDTTTKALNPETTLGDIAYRSATSNTNTRLPIGSNGQILGVSAGVPAWINNDQGDITEVQAGTGISVASGTGPIPIVTSTVATTFDAKGDLVVGTGADTFAKLTVGGTNGHTLQVDSSTATGLKWAAAAGGGKLLQYVSNTNTTHTTNTTASYQATGLSCTITPASASNLVLVFVHIGRAMTGTGSVDSTWQGRIKRGSTVIYDDLWGLYSGTSMSRFHSVDGFYLDSPATTSSTTYTVEFVDSGAGVSAQVGNSASESCLIVIELGV